MSSEITLWLVLHSAILLWWLVSIYRVYGLLGGYGKGVWSASSYYMMEASESFGKSSFWLIMCIIIDVVLLLNL